ncbi:MAG: hypothetical protein ACLS5Y_07940 [Clostridia bacterium]
MTIIAIKVKESQKQKNFSDWGRFFSRKEPSQYEKERSNYESI